MNGSTWRWTLWSTRLPGSKPYSWSAGFTSQAMRHFWSLASKCVIGPAPLLPARIFFQVVSTSAPKGVTSPRPVTTTRRMISLHGKLQKQTASLQAAGSRSCRRRFSQRRQMADPLALVLLDIVDRVLDGADLLGRVVGNFDTEFLFERHDQLDDVEAVGTEIVDEARVLGDLFLLDTKMFDDDLLHPIGSLAHGSFLRFV